MLIILFIKNDYYIYFLIRLTFYLHKIMKNLFPSIPIRYLFCFLNLKKNLNVTLISLYYH